MKKNIMKKYIAAAATLIMAAGCNFLDVTPGVICSDTFYATEAEVQYGLSGVYGSMSSEQFYGNYYSLMLSNVDDLSYFNRPSTSSYTQVYKHDPSSSEVYSAWVKIYAGIRNANAFMEAVAESEFDKDHTYYNEARFLRAYYHFILAQAWGDVPLRDKAVKSSETTNLGVTPQYDVLTWVASEMEACLALMSNDVTLQPSRATKTTVQGILARVYMFMAGVTVKGGDKKAFWYKAMNYAQDVIKSGKHSLNPSYSKVFENMISDAYDTECHESMWEVEFLGDRSSADSWSNGRIGDVIGLQSSGSTGYDKFTCNYAYGQYDGSLKLWDLYWATDRTDDENQMSYVSDVRQEWNLPPYNYAGNANLAPYGGDGTKTKSEASIDKTPYTYNSIPTSVDPLSAPAIRNCGKWRREVKYEGQKNAKMLYTTINYPILRYSDVLLMYAEAANEYYGAPTDSAYNCVKDVRTRATIATKAQSEYDYATFRQFVHNERGRELCFESLRKYDLIRWGEFVNAMHEYAMYTSDDRWTKNAKAGYASAIGAAVQEKHIVLPIPNVELGVNGLLKQNPLW